MSCLLCILLIITDRANQIAQIQSHDHDCTLNVLLHMHHVYQSMQQVVIARVNNGLGH